MFQENHRLFRKPPLLGPPLSLPELWRGLRVASGLRTGTYQTKAVGIARAHACTGAHAVERGLQAQSFICLPLAPYSLSRNLVA